ncbi:hypothetical protein Patl1_09900 [Pistacia atlantica]|uniref:Uncharacterized protein n=1 Tax=Pistacia atlantica TaxID=434234 RepID=A0ACC1A5P5_9ROSI|nr:hypothetical protein Patl1_09900 [Pistacia atlantica]
MTTDGSRVYQNSCNGHQCTAFHLAAFSNSKQPLEYFIGIDKEMYVFSAKDVYGNTVLHVAAANGNLEAVKRLVEYDQKLLRMMKLLSALRILMTKAKPRCLKLLHMGEQK